VKLRYTEGDLLVATFRHPFDTAIGCGNRLASMSLATSAERTGDMARTIVARWRDWSGGGLQHLVLTWGSDAIVAEGVVISTDERLHFAATYRIECDPTWRVTRTLVRLVGADTLIELTSDGTGHWRDGSGTPLPRLAGAIDVDVSATPFTNTLRSGASNLLRARQPTSRRSTFSCQRSR
jgi:Putative glycolipid-binding